MRIVVLAAGVGSRLGTWHPKSLTELSDGETIMGRQLRLIGDTFDPTDICLVVGYKKELIMEAFPDVVFVYNPDYGDTNTSKSLLRALRLTGDEPVMWLNGDVVFDPRVMDRAAAEMERGHSFVCVNTASVGEEEIKYSLDGEGWIREISKQVPDPLGEAVGINFVAAADKPAFVEGLEACAPSDYFERGLELAIDRGMRVRPLDITDLPCIEVDFREDLEQAIERFS